MSIISIPGRDAGAFAKSVLHHLLQHGDIAGRDTAGRTLLHVAVDDWPLDELCAFDAGAEDLEDSDAEPEPDEMDGAPIVLEVARSRRIRAATRCLKALVVVLMLVSVPYIRAEAQQPQGLRVLSLPISTVETTPQCCRSCIKGKPCGDGCISAARQCRRDPGCACSASSGS
jgi:hypothetical protein